MADDKNVVLTSEVLDRLVKAEADKMVKDGASAPVNDSSQPYSKVKDLRPELEELKKAGSNLSVDALDSAEQLINEIWRRDGWMDTRSARKRSVNDQMTYRGLFTELKDHIRSEHVRILIPEVMSNVLREPAEPLMIGTNLAVKINVPAGVQQISFPAVGALQAWDVTEADVYREQDLTFAGKSVAMLGKAGLKLSFTEEAMDWASMDIVSIALRASRRALDRHKENKIWDLAIANANVTFDNAATPATTPTDGTTTGRASDGTLNGTFLVNDLFVMFANAVNGGYLPDTLVTNPHGWFAMARDPIFRAFGFQNGQALFQGMNGAPGSRPTLWQGANMGNESGQGRNDNNPTASTWAPVPFYNQPLRYFVSPFIAWDSTNLTTTIMLFDSSSFVGLAQQEEPRTMEWNDPERDIRNIKVRERYATVVLDEGNGIFLARNVKTNERGYDIEDKLTWQAGSGALPTAQSDIGL